MLGTPGSKGHVLVTGGAGYVGSHTCVELLRAGYDVTVVDNLSNSSAAVLPRIEQASGKRLGFREADIRDYHRLRQVFAERAVDAVMHFAALKAVGESVAQPIPYYRNNVNSTMTLCQIMDEFGVRRLIFSSSATVYGASSTLPVNEGAPLAPTNPYGQAKLMVEQILRDIAQSDADWRICSLRYFNPIGAHPSGLIGEDPMGEPNNLMPTICEVAVGKRSHLRIFGGDYPTVDGTGIRDYIHVVDLAEGHLAALEKLEDLRGMTPVNLGTGRGHSVLELVKTFERESGRPVPYQIAERRPGDVAALYADATLARHLLGWTAKRGLAEMCRDAWRWQSENPDGFSKARYKRADQQKARDQ
jgi:UDP-glucose 4-epimerase